MFSDTVDTAKTVLSKTLSRNEYGVKPDAVFLLTKEIYLDENKCFINSIKEIFGYVLLRRSFKTYYYDDKTTTNCIHPQAPFPTSAAGVIIYNHG